MKLLVVCKHSPNSEESKVCRIIENEGFDVVYAWKDTFSENEIQDVDLVVAIGGDGTALSASHYLTDKPILAVNSSPETSEGFLTTIHHDKIFDKLEELKDKFETEKLERIKISVNGKAIPLLALNEVFIANEKAFLISKYRIKFDSSEESQKSSGLIFSTGTGSTAWFKSAGGEPFSSQDKFIKMVVREPYEGRITNINTKSLTIGEGDFVEVIPETNSVLAIDSIREIKLKKGDVVRIEISEFPLLRIK